jgi:hypothetical protein
LFSVSRWTMFRYDNRQSSRPVFKTNGHWLQRGMFFTYVTCWKVGSAKGLHIRYSGTHREKGTDVVSI